MFKFSSYFEENTPRLALTLKNTFSQKKNAMHESEWTLQLLRVKFLR